VSPILKVYLRNSHVHGVTSANTFKLVQMSPPWSENGCLQLFDQTVSLAVIVLTTPFSEPF
jgi:hypothetical protein